VPISIKIDLFIFTSLDVTNGRTDGQPENIINVYAGSAPALNLWN